MVCCDCKLYWWVEYGGYVEVGYVLVCCWVFVDWMYEYYGVYSVEFSLEGVEVGVV